MSNNTKSPAIDSRQINNTVTEFFKTCGSADFIDEILWDMLSGSLCNPNDPTDDQQNAARTFIYRRLSEFLKEIEPDKAVSKVNSTVTASQQ